MDRISAETNAAANAGGRQAGPGSFLLPAESYCVVDPQKAEVIAASAPIKSWLGLENKSLELDDLGRLFPDVAWGEMLDVQRAHRFGTHITRLCRIDLPDIDVALSLHPLDGIDRGLLLIAVEPPPKSVGNESTFTDVVTGLPDRRALLARWGRLQETAAGNASSSVLLFLDLDDFKAINDRFGHARGDRVLAEMAERLRDSLRQNDLLVRYGGDEFVALLTGVGLPTDAGQIVNRLRENAAAPIEIDQARVEITVSIGLATANDRSEELEEVIHRADQDMYRQKRGQSSAT